MQVTITSSDLANMGRDFRATGRRDLAKEAGQRMRATLRPVVPEVRSAVRATPGGTGDERSARARQARPRDLRDAVARGVQVKVSLSRNFAGVRLRVDTRHFPEGEKHLPQYLEGTLPRWRSRNWGREDEYKQQDAHPYFFPTVRRHIPRVQAELAEIVRDLSSQLAGGSS